MAEAFICYRPLCYKPLQKKARKWLFVSMCVYVYVWGHGDFSGDCGFEGDVGCSVTVINVWTHCTQQTGFSRAHTDTCAPNMPRTEPSVGLHLTPPMTL